MQIESAVLELPTSLKVTFVWCPGHRDILGNELADQLAKDALDSPSTPSLEIKSNYKKVYCRALEGRHHHVYQLDTVP
jgi:ribonuclease HI